MNSRIKETVSHTWIIENFESQGSWLECPTFSSTTNESKFSFSLCTNNQSEKAFLYVEFWYEIVPSYYKFRVSILGKREEKLFSKEYHWRMCPYDPKCRYNIANFMYKSHLPKFLINGSLTLFFEVDILNGPSECENTDKYKNSLLDELSMDYQSLHESDVSFVVRGKEFKAHKNILAAQSSVFKAMFCADLEEKKQNRVEIIDVDLEVFEHLLAYIYTGMVFSMSAHAAELFFAADKYQLEHLKSICEQFLSTTLTNDSVVPLLVFADMHHSVHLKSKCIENITKNSVEISKTKQWNELIIKSRPDLLVELYLDMSDRTHNLLNAS